MYKYPPRGGGYELPRLSLGKDSQASRFCPTLRVTVATKRLNGFFREIELLENRIFNPPRTIYFNYSTFNVSHVLHSTKNASKD
jgi:hypothetical protein